MFSLTPTKIDVVLGVVILSVIIIAVYVHRKPLSSGSASSQNLGIKELVDKVQSELVDAANSSSRTAMFEVKSFDLEINFLLTDRQTQSGGIQAKVITLGDEIESSAQKVQKITLHMETVRQRVHQGSDANTNQTDLTQQPKGQR